MQKKKKQKKKKGTKTSMNFQIKLWLTQILTAY